MTKPLTPEQEVLLLAIEKQIRQVIAKQVEEKFHGIYHNESHVIAQFIKNS